MGKFVEDNESTDLFQYSVDVVKHATGEYRRELEIWEDTCEGYRCGGYNAYRDYNPWRTVIGLELEMEGTSFCIENYSSLLNYGIFSEDSTVDAEFKGLPFRLSDWLRIAAENRFNFDKFLRYNSEDNGAGLHIHISQRCLSEEAAEYIRGFLCNCGESVLETVAGRELPNNYVTPYTTLDSGKYGYTTRHKSGVTWEIRIFQSPNDWQGLIRCLVWVAMLVQKAESTSDRPGKYGPLSYNGIPQETWKEVFQEMLDKFEGIYPQIVSNLEKLPLRQEDICLEYLYDEDDEEGYGEPLYYDPVTDDEFESYETYVEVIYGRIIDDPFSYMEDGYNSIKDLYEVGDYNLFYESCFPSLWVSDIYEVIRYDDDRIIEMLHEDLWEYIHKIPWKRLLVPTADNLFRVNRNNPLGRLTHAIQEYGFNEDAIVEEFVENFLSLDFPEWYRDKCNEYHRYNYYSNDYSLQKHPTEEVLYEYLREEIRKLVRETIQANWVTRANWVWINEYDSNTLIRRYSNPVLEVQLFSEYCDLYPMLPLGFEMEYKVANAVGIPSCWIVK